MVPVPSTEARALPSGLNDTAQITGPCRLSTSVDRTLSSSADSGNAPVRPRTIAPSNQAIRRTELECNMIVHLPPNCPSVDLLTCRLAVLVLPATPAVLAFR